MTLGQVKNLTLAALVVAVMALTVATFYGWNRITSDEHSTCLIQARGLPAGHELAASMLDIHMLLTAPPTTPAERRAVAERPQSITRIVRSLDDHLAAYLAAESRQPGGRRC